MVMFVLRPWQLYLVILFGWMNRQQQEVIEYLRTENQVLKEKLGKKRILLNDDQRRRLGVKGRVLGRKLLEEFGTLFTPITILRWHRMLVAKKWDTSDQPKPRRPRVRQVIVDLGTRRSSKVPPSTSGNRATGTREPRKRALARSAVSPNRPLAFRGRPKSAVMGWA